MVRLSDDAVGSVVIWRTGVTCGFVVVLVGCCSWTRDVLMRTWEALRRKLPDPTTSVPQLADRPRPGRARQLGTGQVQELIAGYKTGYKSGETVYESGARFGIERRTVRSRHG